MTAHRRGHGEGSVFRRKRDGLWVAVVNEGRVAGRRKRTVFYGKSRHEVAEKLKAALHSQQRGLPLSSDRQSVGAYLTSWLDSTRTSLRPRTWLRYEQYVRIHALPALGDIPLAQLAPQHLRSLYADRLGAGLSAASVGHLHAVLHTALEQAARDGIVPRNVADLVTPPRVEHHETMTLAPEQARAFLDAAHGDRLEGLYVVAVTTGMRQGELLGLRWRDVSFETGTLSVTATLQHTPDGYVFGEPKTSSSRRNVTLSEVAIAALRQHRTRQIEERLGLGPAWQDLDLVFANTVGGPLDGTALLRSGFHPLLKRAGLPRIRFHDLRHTAATLMLGRGVPLKVTSEMLGHSTTAITADLYSHVTPTMQRQAANAMDAVLSS